MQNQEAEAPAQPETSKFDELLKYKDSEIERYKAEAAKWQTEAKDAFESRDKAKKTKASDSSTEMLAQYESMKVELAQSQQSLLDIKTARVNEQKLTLVKSKAMEMGLKDNYLDTLNKFINVDQVNLDEPISAELELDAMKKQLPDLFGVTSPADKAKTAWEVPKLQPGSAGAATVTDIAAEYNKALLNTSVPQERLVELKRKLNSF